MNLIAKKRSSTILMALLIGLGMISCGSSDAEAPSGRDQARRAGGQNAGAPKARPIPIAVANVVIGDATSTYVTTTTLEAEHHAEILSRTTGVIEKIFHEEGDVVEAGDVLLYLEDKDQQLAVKQSELRVAQLQQEFDRQQRMVDAGIVSQEVFDQSRNALETAQAELEVAKLQLSYTQVRAPFSGRIVRRHQDLGAHVTPSAQLFEIMDVTPLLARIFIPSNRIGNVAEGQEIKLRLDSIDTELMGTTRLVSPIVDPETGTIKITAEIKDYPSGTRPGDFAEAQIITDRRENTMLVPSVAVFEENGREILYIVEDGKAVRKPVVVGYIEGGNSEIIRGITPDDLIVIKGQRNLREGIPVEILEGPTQDTPMEGQAKVPNDGVRT